MGRTVDLTRLPFLYRVVAVAGAHFDALCVRAGRCRTTGCVFAYRNELLRRGKSTATIARHISVVKSVAKYARLTGQVTWAIEIPVLRIERSRDTRGSGLEPMNASDYEKN